jgi:hypothetical protein
MTPAEFRELYEFEPAEAGGRFIQTTPPHFGNGKNGEKRIEAAN